MFFETLGSWIFKESQPNGKANRWAASAKNFTGWLSPAPGGKKMAIPSPPITRNRLIQRQRPGKRAQPKPRQAKYPADGPTSRSMLKATPPDTPHCRNGAASRREIVMRTMRCTPQKVKAARRGLVSHSANPTARRIITRASQKTFPPKVTMAEVNKRSIRKSHKSFGAKPSRLSQAFEMVALFVSVRKATSVNPSNMPRVN